MVSGTLSSILLAVVLASLEASSVFPSMRKRMLKPKQPEETVQKANSPVPETLNTVPAEPAAVAVPAVVDAGDDGNPQLPPVAHMLSGAADTLKGLSTQTSALQARVVQAQMQIEAKLARQKAAFEAKLKSQEEDNLNIQATNNNITSEIKALETSNIALRQRARELTEANGVMRTQLQNLQLHMADAKSFVAKSLSATDDSKNSMLQVLRSAGSKEPEAESDTSGEADSNEEDDAGDDTDTDQDETDNEAEGTSFLALASTKVLKTDPAAADVKGVADAPDSADSVLTVLYKEVSQLKEQEKESEEKLKHLFIKDFRAGSLRRKALLAQQQKLKDSRNHLASLQSQLMSAEAHLKSTHGELKARLHGLGQFLQKLAHVALAPQHEVPHLIEVLPKAVSTHS